MRIRGNHSAALDKRRSPKEKKIELFEGNQWQNRLID